MLFFEGDALRVISAGGVQINGRRIVEPQQIFVPGEHILQNKLTLIRIGVYIYYYLSFRWRCDDLRFESSASVEHSNKLKEHLNERHRVRISVNSSDEVHVERLPQPHQRPGSALSCENAGSILISDESQN